MRCRPFAWLLLTPLFAPACVTTPSDHCAENGGDAACGSGWCSSCSVEAGPGGVQGCVDGTPADGAGECRAWTGSGLHCADRFAEDGVYGDARCRQTHGDDKPYCNACMSASGTDDDTDGCVAGPPPPDCGEAGATASTGVSETGSGTETRGESTSSTTTTATSDTSDASTTDTGTGTATDTGMTSSSTTATGTDTGTDTDTDTESGDTTGPGCMEADCNMMGEVCDAAGLACVPCTPDDVSQCGPGLEGCIADTCVGCDAVGSDCQAGDTNVCDPTDATCVECTEDSHCTFDAAQPACETVGRVCVECTDSGDCGVGTPECDTVANTCVECLDDSHCSGTTPVCDTAANTCIPCTEHSECAEACNLETGACIAGPAVWVDINDCAGLQNGSMSDPYCEIQDAVTGTVGDVVIRVRAGTYSTKVDPGPGRTLAVRGAGAGMVMLSLAADAVNVDGVSLFAEGMTITSTGADGVQCSSGANVWLDEVTVQNSAALGVNASNCDVHLRRSVVFDNTGGGVSVAGSGSLGCLSSFIVENGDFAGSSVSGILADDAVLDIRYCTLGNNSGNGIAHTIVCTGTTSGMVHDSILSSAISDDAETGCGSVGFETSSTDDPALAVGSVQQQAFDPSNFVDRVNGDYHLTIAGQTEYADIARWNTGDPTTDIDGDLRPTVDDTPDLPGADTP